MSISNVICFIAGISCGWHLTVNIDTLRFFAQNPSLIMPLIVQYAKSCYVTEKQTSQYGKYEISKIMAFSGSTYIGEIQAKNLIAESKKCNENYFLVVELETPHKFTVFINSECSMDATCQCQSTNDDCKQCEWPFVHPEKRGGHVKRESIIQMQVRCMNTHCTYDMTTWVHAIQGTMETFGGSSLSLRDFARVWGITESQEVQESLLTEDLLFAVKSVFGQIYPCHSDTLATLDRGLWDLIEKKSHQRP